MAITKTDAKRVATEFPIGTHVRIQPWTDSFMQGFTRGRVTSTRGTTVYVELDQNRSIKRGFHFTKVERD